MDWLIAAGTVGLAAEYSFKTTAVLILALLAAAAARRRPAAIRHFVLSLALVGLLLLPLLSLVPAGWRTAFLPAGPAGARARTSVPNAPSSPPAPSVSAEMTPAISALNPDEAAARRSPTGADDVYGRSSPRAIQDASPSPRFPAAAGSGRNTLDIVLALLWSAGLIVLSMRLAIGLAGAVRLTAEGTALAGPSWHVILERFLRLVPLRRKVHLKSHPQVVVPLTWGWRKPVILLPAGTDGWTEQERSSALYHELAHVKRADFLVMLAVRASLAVFWWNPLCWIVYREFRKEQEIACDELALRAGIKPSAYAASLLAFRRSAGFRWSPSAALPGLLGRSSFPERMAAILKQKSTFEEVKMRTRIMLAGALVLAVGIIGTARPAVGVEKSAVMTTVVETAAPGAAALDIALPAAEAPVTQAEPSGRQEKEKEKAVLEKEIVVKPKDGKAPIEIVITEGDRVRKLVLEKPLTITKGRDGKALALTSDGMELHVLKDEPLRLVIKSGALEFQKEGKTVLFDGPDGKIVEGEVTVIKQPGAGECEVFVIRPKEPGSKTAWTVIEQDKKGAVWITQEFPEKPHKTIWIREGGRTHASSPAGRREFLDKVRELREQVEAVKAKKMDIAALEESLKKLEAELQAKNRELGEIRLETAKEPGEPAIRVFEGDAPDEPGALVVKVIADDDGTIQIILSGLGSGEGRDASPLSGATLDRLKKDLPEGYRILKSAYDKEAGTMIFKIAPPEGGKPDKELVRKLVESLKEEIKSSK